MSREEDFKAFMTYLGSDLFGKAYYKNIGIDEYPVYAFFSHPLVSIPMAIAIYHIGSDGVPCFEYVHVGKDRHMHKIDRKDKT